MIDALAGFQPTRDFALELDARDELAVFRDEFLHADPDLIYLDGNSLGRMPRKTAELLAEVVREQWGARLIRSWGEGWYEAPRRLGDKIGQLLGAAAGQVIVSDSTSVNLYKLVMAAAGLRPTRRTLLTDRLNFPSDVYILQGCAQALGPEYDVRLAPESGDPSAAVLDAMDQDTAVVVLSLVAFKSGYLYDPLVVARRAQEVGALVLWDLSHACGAVPVDLDGWGADFAVGCTYKYLNGGPGAPAFLYVRRAHQAQAMSPVWGWFGEASPFAFDLQYHPAEGISRFLAGTPPLLSTLAIEPGLDLLLEAGMQRVRRKSVLQTEYLVALFDHALAPLGFRLGSPRDPERRGSHISLQHPDGYRINRALIAEMEVLPDFREPDLIRLGVAPLYTSYLDLWEAVQRIAEVVLEGRFRKYSDLRQAVT